MRYMFGTGNVEQSVNKPKFKPKSTFVPHVNHPSIDTFCRVVEQEILGSFQNAPYSYQQNLDREERNAIQELAKDTEIVIKPADKGGAIVILNNTDYLTEAYRQLNDETFYRKLKTDPTVDFKKIIVELTTQALEQHWITKEEFNYLNKDHPVTPVFYMLPKIHKSLIKPKGRPIVASNESLLEPLSNFVDFFIKPFVQKLPAFVQDSTDVINKISELQDLPTDTILATFDVESLYTNISHERGITALEYFLQNRPEDENPPNTFICDLASSILRLNFFSFHQGEHYLQIKGTSMGSTFAPSYANLYVGFFEQQFIFNEDRNPFYSNIIRYFRYLDDVLCVFKGSQNELNEFTMHLNEMSPDLKFTAESDSKRVHFLDMWITLEDGRLTTTLYRKETDRNSFLLASSSHPTALKNGLPKSQFYRLRRICHSTEEYEENALDMKQRFLSRGYPMKTVEEAYNMALSTPRSHLLEKSVKKEKKFSVSCITTFTPKSHIIKNTIMKYWHLLCDDPSLQGKFEDPPLFVSRRGPNLRNKLVKARVRSTPSQTLLAPLRDGNHPCGNCAQCNSTHKTRTFKHPRSGKSYSVKGFITCKTKNVIYLLRCPCDKVYVGKTTRSLKQRISEHKSSIRRADLNYPVACHFIECAHPVSSLRFQGIEQVTLSRGGNIDKVLCQRELFWIHTLDALHPKGLNVDFDMGVML